MVRKLRSRIDRLHKLRGKMQVATKEKGDTHKSLTANQKEEVARKTGYKCHICGKRLISANHRRQYDHIRAKSTGGHDGMRNYLLACHICNKLRGAKLSEEVQLLLALGELARRAILEKTELGDVIAETAVKRHAIKGWLERSFPSYPKLKP